MPDEHVPVGPVVDMYSMWDPEGTRTAEVYASHGRLEIRLVDEDHAWVQQALDLIADGASVVIGCPDASPTPVPAPPAPKRRWWQR